MPAITARHNAILDRLIRAIPPGARIDREKCPVPGHGPSGLKLDLTVWREDGHVVIADVRCSHEADEAALERTFDEKVEKYTDLAREVAAKISGVRSAAVRPFIMGALGGWHPANEKCLVELGIPRHRRKMLRQLCVADAIAGSEAIWSRVESGVLSRRFVDPSTSAAVEGSASRTVGQPAP
jgi:hypothetical protein